MLKVVRLIPNRQIIMKKTPAELGFSSFSGIITFR